MESTTMTPSITQSGLYGSSVALQSMSELYPRDGEVDDALYLVTEDDGQSEIAAFVRAEGSLTVVTPTRVMPNVAEGALRYQKLGATVRARRKLRSAYNTGMSCLQDAVYDIRSDMLAYLS